jgi:hypothetical protein
MSIELTTVAPETEVTSASCAAGSETSFSADPPNSGVEGGQPARALGSSASYSGFWLCATSRSASALVDFGISFLLLMA